MVDKPKTDKAVKPPITAANLAKVVKLLGMARELQQQQGELLTEIDAILGGQASTAEKLKAVETGFAEAWVTRYGPASYIWRQPMDRANIKRLLKHLPAEEITARAARYIRSEDGFFTRQRHPFGLFVSSINQWALQSATPGELDLDGGDVVGCEHDPRCSSDAEHTRRKMADMRSGQ